MVYSMTIVMRMMIGGRRDSVVMVDLVAQYVVEALVVDSAADHWMLDEGRHSGHGRLSAAVEVMFPLCSCFFSFLI